MSVKDSIATEICELSKEKFNDFLTLNPIPSEYHVILPKSNHIIFDAPPEFIYLGLTLLVVPSSPLLFSCARLMVVSPLSTSFEGSLICVEMPAEVTVDSRESLKPELFVINPRSVAAWIKDRMCKTKGGSSRPHVKRKLSLESSTSRATRAKTSSLKDDVSYLTLSDDDEGLPDVLELKDAIACHLKIFAITLPA
nr:hypothetical protein [Tanacetum cinerariifolium]